jgi:hypothetical protein
MEKDKFKSYILDDNSPWEIQFSLHKNPLRDGEEEQYWHKQEIEGNHRKNSPTKYHHMNM